MKKRGEYYLACLNKSNVLHLTGLYSNAFKNWQVALFNLTMMIFSYCSPLRIVFSAHCVHPLVARK